MVLTRNVNATVEKIEVLSLSSSKHPQFDGEKRDKYLMWKLKFEADQMMKGLFEASQPEFESKLPSKEKAVLNLSIKDQKKQHDADKMNQKAMMQLALLFTQVSLMNKLNVEKRRDKDWPTRKAHRVMSTLIKEFEPEDTMAEMEMEQALAKMKLGPKKDPSKLLNKLASIECKYSLELSNSKKKAQVLRLGGSLYSSIIATTNMIYHKKRKTLTCEALFEEMRIQWRLSGGKGKDD
jgi:hypothetical protein